jgi:hypothetical protein
MGIFTKFLKSIDIFGKDYKFFITNKKNIFKSTFGGLLTIIYIILMILAVIYSYTKFASSIPQIMIFNNLEKGLEREFDATNLNSVVNITDMYIRDFSGGKYHRLFVYLDYKNLSNQENFSSVEILRPFMPNTYSVKLNLSVLMEAEIRTFKILYSQCNSIERLKPNITINEELLLDCNYNISEFNDFMKRNDQFEEPVIIDFKTWKITINPFISEKYVKYEENHIDYIKIQNVKTKNQIDFKLYVFEESTGWNNLRTNISYAIDLDYEVGYPVFLNTDFLLYQGYHEEFKININRNKNYVRISYMNVYELLSLLGGYMNIMTFVFRFISNSVIENNVQIYRMIKEISSKQLNSLIEEKSSLHNNNTSTYTSKENSNNINDVSLLEKNKKMKKGFYKFFFFKICSCCFKKNDERHVLINYVKESFSIFYLQRKLNELELLKYLLLDGNSIQKIRDASQLKNPLINIIRINDLNEIDFTSNMNILPKMIYNNNHKC